jgi:hypothetical protein
MGWEECELPGGTVYFEVNRTLGNVGNTVE